MIRYRTANTTDIKNIATLHAESWRLNYRGIWSDDFLDNRVFEERLSVWEKRIKEPSSNQYILIAEENGILCGFASMYFDKDTTFGNYLDNLHVSRDNSGRGIGTELMKRTALATQEASSDSKYWLWVLEENHSARKFYDKLGAVNVEVTSVENPDGELSKVCRYFWETLETLETLV